MNSLVIFELILVASCLVALVLMRRTYFPMNLLWAFGVVAIGAAASIGAFKYGGFKGLDTYHSLTSNFAGSVGIVSFAVACIGGVFAQKFYDFGWWVLLVLLSALSGVMLFDQWQLSEEIRYVVVGIMGLCGLYKLFIYPKTGIFLFLGVLLLVLAGLGSAWIANTLSFPSLNVYHTILSLSVLSLGFFASKE